MRALGLAMVTLLVTACGGSVDNGQNTGGKGGHGATGGVGATGGHGAVGGAGTGGGPGGDGGVGNIGGGPDGGMGNIGGDGGVGNIGGDGGVGNVGGGGTGGGLNCTQTSDGLNVLVTSTMNPPPSCGFDMPATYEITGDVIKADSNIIVINTCPPNADCVADSTTTIQINAADLNLWVPMGAYVKFNYTLSPAFGGCTTSVFLQNVPSWGGLPNPVFADEHFYFIGVDGNVDAPPEAPFKVAPQALGCTNGGPGCGGMTPDLYALSFFPMAGGGSAVVGMGQTNSFFTGTQMLLVRNLRSYQSGACDDYWNWAWWVMDEPPLGG